ncbi:MAG: membrane protein insertase YidC [Cyclobacteriaceae bacterium]
MDRNQFIGLIVMLVFITVYFQFFAPEPIPVEESSNNTEVTSDTTNKSSISTQPETILSDSAMTRLNEMKYGIFSSAAKGVAKEIEVENDDLKLKFSTKGGLLTYVELKEFKDFRGEPLILVDESHSDMDFTVNHLSKNVDLSELYFTTTSRNTKVTSDSTRISFRLQLSGGQTLTYVYTIPKSGYEIGFKIDQQNITPLLNGGLTLSWKQKMNRLELDFKDARNRSTVKYRTTDGEVDELSMTSTDNEEENLESPINWVSFRQKFFTSSVISASPFTKGYVSSAINFEDTTSIKNVALSLNMPLEDFVGNKTAMRFYFGPNNYAILKNVAPDFSENVDLGWFVLSWINKYAIIPIFHFLERFTSNYGIIIIIMVFILKLVLSPLTYKSHLGMAKMKVMKPELDELKEKHGEDMQKAQQEQMALYQKVGINPLSGCIPMVLQMPILFAMFYFFPNSIELRQEGFLWASDLSTYDSVLNLPFTIPFYGDHVSLFTILMTASTILYTWSNSQVTTVQGPMKSLQYVMPIMFLFFLNSYASGLTFYYFVSNIVSFGQIALFRKFIDEDKIKAILDENRKKNKDKKKSKFQQKLEDAMKASKEAQKNSKKKNK